MECLHPRTIRDPLEDPTFPGFHGTMLVPCGKCLACRINRRREWTQRLIHESAFASSSCFVTLTYDQEHVPVNDDGLMVVNKHDCQLFHRYIRRKYPKSRFRYFLNSEYGPDTQRPHYHAIYYNLPEEVIFSGTPCFQKGKLKYYYGGELQKLWSKGEVTVSPMTRERAGYCAKYFIDKLDNPEFREPNFSIMSRKPGIGCDYADKISDKVRFYGMKGCLTDKGNYIKLPRYYRDKITPPYERTWNRLLGIDLNFISHDEAIRQEKERQVIYQNSDLVEHNLIRAMTFKGHKSKI